MQIFKKTIEALHKKYGKNVVLMDETSIGVVDNPIEGRGAPRLLGLEDLSTFLPTHLTMVIRNRKTGNLGSTTDLGKAPE